MSYFITGVGSNQFSVDGSGVVTTVAALDREATECYSLIYNAKDLNPDNSRTSSVPLGVCLDDINDQIPQFVSVPTPCTFDLSEGQAATDLMTFQVQDGDKIGTVNIAVDVTTNDILFTVTTSG